MPLKLRQIEAFRAVMREGSMVRASASMAITQPAISYLISSLETAVGFPLFSRRAGRITATAEATQLMAEVDRLYDGLGAVETIAKQIANHQRASLRVLISPAMSSGQVVHCLGRFVTAHGGIRLRIDVESRSTIVHRIQSGQADLAICSLSVDSAVESTLLFRSDLVCVTSSSLIEGSLDVSPERLKSIPLVGLTSKGVIRPSVDAWFAAAGVSPEYVVDAAEAHMAIELVRSGVPAAVVSSLSLPGASLGGGLISLPLAPRQRVEIGVIVPRTEHPNRTAAALVEFLQTEISMVGVNPP